MVGEDVTPAAGVAVDQLDLGASRRSGRARFHAVQSSRSLLGPVAVRTTSPSTSRLTAVSTERGNAGWSANVNWSARMCPQPPVFSSTMSIRAVWPLNSETFQFVQFSASPSCPVLVRTTWPSTIRFTDVGGLRGVARVGMVAAADRKLM